MILQLHLHAFLKDMIFKYLFLINEKHAQKIF